MVKMIKQKVTKRAEGFEENISRKNLPASVLLKKIKQSINKITNTQKLTKKLLRFYLYITISQQIVEV